MAFGKDSNPLLSCSKCLSIYACNIISIDMRLPKAWTDIDRLSVIWKSDLSDKIKSSGCVNTAIWMHHVTADKAYGEKILTEIIQEW